MECSRSLFGVLLDYYGVLFLYSWTTYNNSFVSSCIEFILSMELPKGKKEKPLSSLLMVIRLP